MFNIVAKRSIFFIIYGLVIIAGIIAMVAFGGLNTDIDFTGGTTIQFDLDKTKYSADVEAKLRDIVKETVKKFARIL